MRGQIYRGRAPHRGTSVVERSPHLDDIGNLDRFCAGNVQMPQECRCYAPFIILRESSVRRCGNNPPAIAVIDTIIWIEPSHRLTSGTSGVRPGVLLANGFLPRGAEGG
jgi:hypothetical protein